MQEYYIYLWKTNLFHALGLLFLTLFIGTRLIWKGLFVFKQKESSSTRFRYLIKSLGWIGILGTYFLMFYLSEPDWFSRPGLIQGEVESVEMTKAPDQPFQLKIVNEADVKVLYINESTYMELDTGQQVKLMFTPHRLEVVTCEILPVSP